MLVVVVIVLIVVQAGACSYFCHHLAKLKGHDAGEWGWSGFIFSVFALVAAAGLPDRGAPIEKGVGGSDS